MIKFCTEERILNEHTITGEQEIAVLEYLRDHPDTPLIRAIQDCFYEGEIDIWYDYETYDSEVVDYYNAKVFGAYDISTCQYKQLHLFDAIDTQARIDELRAELAAEAEEHKKLEERWAANKAKENK